MTEKHNFIVRYAKVCAVEPMQPVSGAGTEADRFKVHLDGGQEIIVNRVAAEDIIATVSAANQSDCASFSKGEG